jgi:hypothetical protein
MYGQVISRRPPSAEATGANFTFATIEILPPPPHITRENNLHHTRGISRVSSSLLNDNVGEVLPH